MATSYRNDFYYATIWIKNNRNKVKKKFAGDFSSSLCLCEGMHLNCRRALHDQTSSSPSISSISEDQKFRIQCLDSSVCRTTKKVAKFGGSLNDWNVSCHLAFQRVYYFGTRRINQSDNILFLKFYPPCYRNSLPSRRIAFQAKQSTSRCKDHSGRETEGIYKFRCYW